MSTVLLKIIPDGVIDSICSMNCGYPSEHEKLFTFREDG